MPRSEAALDYDFPIWGTQGGGLVKQEGDHYVFVESPKDFPDIKVGDTMHPEWGLAAANEYARAEVEAEFPDDFHVTGDLGDEDEPVGRDADIVYWRGLLQSLGNLTRTEVEELVRLEFADQLAVSQQLRRYYLKLKSEKPIKAEELWSAIPRSYKRRVTSRKAVKRLCVTLYRYWNGFVLYFNGRTYSVNKGEFYRVN